MHKQLHCWCRVYLTITTKGPLRIGTEFRSDPHGPDLQCVRTNDKVFLPGSSLKGVIRSHAERIARTLAESHGRLGCCDPFGDESCSKGLERAKKARREAPMEWGGPDAYKLACPACKLFGCLHLAGRFAISDGMPVGSPPKTERRDGVGIDRRTGGPSHGALFQGEVVPANVRFDAEMTITNFELWQLGWLAFVLRDMEQGRVFVGAGKSRGLGQVTATVTKVEFAYPVPRSDLADVGLLVGPKKADAYGFSRKPLTVPFPLALPEDDFGPGVRGELTDAGDIRALWQAVAEPAPEYLKAWPTSAAPEGGSHATT